ncbi:MAG: HAD hydrolase-like protein [Tatlockia sp.]|nr:HAD hydrolase-like protein [Tatlockia sp.]
MLNTRQCNLIFDFDGTLVDSFNTVMQKFNLLAEDFKFRKIDEIEIEDIKNMTSNELIKYLKIPLLKLPKVMQKAREIMRNEIPNLAAFENLPEVLDELYNSSCALGIVTSNSLDNVVSWLQNNKIDHLFDFIHSESSYFGKKQSLKKIIRKHRMEPSQTFYIGDETRDVEAALKSGIGSIAVSWGFNSLKALASFKPDFIANKPEDLLII